MPTQGRISAVRRTTARSRVGFAGAPRAALASSGEFKSRSRVRLILDDATTVAGIAFIDGSIWVSNINRDRVDMPEGSIVKIDVQ